MARGERIRKTMQKKKLIVIAAALAVIVGATVGLKACSDKKKASTNMKASETHTVERGDVSLTITGSAAVEPYDRREVIAKVSGDITYCPFEVGEAVNEGDVVYQFDTSEKNISMRKQQISLENSQNSYQKALDEQKKLTVKAKASGVISNLNVKVGDEVKAGTKLADISNTEYLEVTLPFTSEQAAGISVGDGAYVSSSVHMSNVSGTVTHKSATSRAGADGSKLVDVEISFKNEGAFAEGITVGGAVGSYISPGSGTVRVSDSGSVSAEAEGEIVKLYYANGDYVEKGATIATVTSDNITDSIKTSKNNYESSKLSMEEAQETLDDYTHKAQISGTVIEKNAKAGDTIDKTNSAEPLMVIADISKLKFSLDIDELDVSKVQTGQVVEITCDALPEEKFTGEITNLSVEGTSQNGVTTYSAEVVIAEPGNLRPSMNIDASVVVDSAENALIIPSEDVKSAGNIYYVFRKTDGEDSSKEQKTQDKRPEGMTPPTGGERPERPEGMTPSEGMEMPEGMTPPEGMEMPQGEISESVQRRLPQAPDGFETVIVTVGVVGDDYTEILSGLSEGDEIYAQTGSGASTGNMPAMMGGMSMGGMGGGMPSGGAPGGGMR